MVLRVNKHYFCFVVIEFGSVIFPGLAIKLTQERIKGTEKASPIHTPFHRSRVIFRIEIKLPRALRGCFVQVPHD